MWQACLSKHRSTCLASALSSAPALRPGRQTRETNNEAQADPAHSASESRTANRATAIGADPSDLQSSATLSTAHRTRWAGGGGADDAHWSGHCALAIDSSRCCLA